MASAWGTSWGVAWGNSWGAGITPVVEVDTHDGGKERERIKRKRRDRESLREQLEAAFSPPVVAQETREHIVLAKPRAIVPKAVERKPDNLAPIIEAGTLGALNEQDDEEAIIVLLGAF